LGTRLPYWLGEWCQRALKRTLRREGGRGGQARFRCLSLVPRTRSSRTRAASPIAKFGFKRGTKIIELLVSLDSEVRMRVCRKCLRTSESGH
jgi:hypothetical protein